MKVAVVGLGYVGLPLAVALDRKHEVVGFDISSRRISELRSKIDRTQEVEEAELASANIRFTDNSEEMRGCSVFIVTVPTPVDPQNLPDLGMVKSACQLIGPILGRDGIVVFESTVYPGVTEEICGPELEKSSGLKCGRDFFLGYSPERINPGDKVHRVEAIVKVVAGQNDAVTKTLGQLYGSVITAGVYLAPNIKTAEAAKVIENAQRDINIAFANEVAIICQKLGLSAHEVLAAAGTKWNFLPFRPGMVGGHCIGVDPYYLAHRATQLGHDPEVILAGRRINDRMGTYIADRISDLLLKPSKILVMGLTFKENVPDLRNSKVIDLIRRLELRGHQVAVHDAFADPEEAKHEYGLELIGSLSQDFPYDVLVGAVAHKNYEAMGVEELESLTVADALIADIKGMWLGLKFGGNRRKWQL